ncbi:alpha/beta hydrolase [Persicitalea jodogahamensis]|uniref:Esterase n=1 Tax=Persicitalea jodogahamensis TaxID=402147 RepID=A0A8J3G783_9BACT|nr:phospholipase [Persicitalea jodogahamensis]GHB53704.1 esterase [Persicitalea jodogahamensis]
MKAADHSIAITRTARYFTLGEMYERTRQVWFVLHGYGQLAEYFVRKFEKIQDPETLIVAPEALSRFYLDHNSGRVGASWMTREDRLHEIEDYVAYLESIQQEIFKYYRSDNVQITVLGFSQGTATACRWVNQSKMRCDRLILWGGYFANGILELVERDRLPPQNTHFVYGDKDEYLNQLNPDKYLEKLRTELPFMKILEYEGGHAVDTEVLSRRFGEKPFALY